MFAWVRWAEDAVETWVCSTTRYTLTTHTLFVWSQVITYMYRDTAFGMWIIYYTGLLVVTIDRITLYTRYKYTVR